MKYEIALVSFDEQCKVSGLGQPIWEDVNIARAGLRTTTDKLIEEGLETNTIAGLSQSVAETMLMTARVLYVYRCDPGVPDLIEAAKALVIEARKVMDKGLMLHSPEMTSLGGVMMELSCRGIFHALGLDYDATLMRVRDEAI